MAFNEEETRFHLIDPVLRVKGYADPQRIKLETPAPVEPTGPKGRRRKGAGRTDYLLCVQVGNMPSPMPVAVLEAKRESEDPLKGMQQAKGYADCQRFDVQYVFASNGHLYGDYDKPSGQQTGPFPLPDFPHHADLCTRYAHDKGIDLSTPEAALLFQADSPAWSLSRYYQDAAIRAAFEKIIVERQAGHEPRVLLTLATGAGKTIIATNLLWRMGQAGLLPKPALFLCDRDELREQAYAKLKAAFGGNARIVQNVRGQNAAANARIQIATYQTLGIDENGDGSFLTDHYGEDAFSVIIIDECHRSAWGQWSQVLTRNPNAIHIGLTATPRKLHPPKRDKRSREVAVAIAQDEQITAHNDMQGKALITATAEKISDDGAKNSNCKLIKKGSLLFSFKLTVGRTSFAGMDLYTNEAIAAFDVDEAKAAGIDLDYLSLVLPLAAAGDKTKNSMGAALLNKDKILELEIPYTRIETQRQIADDLKGKLVEVDTARRAVQSQLRDVALLRSCLMRQAFDALHDVPRKVLGNWAKTTSGSTPPRGDKRYWSSADIPWVKTGEVAFAPILVTEESISRQALKECSLTLLPPQSVLVAMIGQGKTRGQSAVLQIEATTNQNCFAILPNETWDAEYLYHWLMASYEDLRDLSASRGGSQSALNGGLLNALEIPAPEIDEQQRIVKRLKSQLVEVGCTHQAVVAQLAEIEGLPQRILAQAFDAKGDAP